MVDDDPANRDLMSYEEDGGRHSIYYLRPKSRDDLQKRMAGHRKIADLTYGMFGRSPDHVASFVTGMAIKPDASSSGPLSRNCQMNRNAMSLPQRCRPKASSR